MKLLSFGKSILIATTLMTTSLSFSGAVYAIDNGSDRLKDTMTGDPISNNR